MKKFLAIVVTCLFTSALVTASSVSTPEKGTVKKEKKCSKEYKSMCNKSKTAYL